jgi:Ca2+-binding RTX toxin-like protein
MTNKTFPCAILLILGCLAFAGPIIAAPDHKPAKGPKAQPAKKCPHHAIVGTNVILTKQFPNFLYGDNGTPNDPSDDFYQTCSDVHLTACQAPVPATPGIGFTIVGSNGPNIIVGSPYSDIICGMNGNDTINGMGGDDTVYGDNGSDDLSGGLGNDLVYGGNGSDTLFGYDEVRDALLPAKEHNDLLDTELANELLLPSFVPPFFPSVDGDFLYGDNGNDQLFGGPDADRLWGGNGKDHLNGGDGVDTVDGGRGKDSCTDLNDGCALASHI